MNIKIEKTGKPRFRLNIFACHLKPANYICILTELLIKASTYIWYMCYTVFEICSVCKVDFTQVIIERCALR